MDKAYRLGEQAFEKFKAGKWQAFGQNIAIIDILLHGLRHRVVKQ